jgi:hypothetical protein
MKSACWKSAARGNLWSVCLVAGLIVLAPSSTLATAKDVEPEFSAEAMREGLENLRQMFEGRREIMPRRSENRLQGHVKVRLNQDSGISRYRCEIDADDLYLTPSFTALHPGWSVADAPMQTTVKGAGPVGQTGNYTIEGQAPSLGAIALEFDEENNTYEIHFRGGGIYATLTENHGRGGTHVARQYHCSQMLVIGNLPIPQDGHYRGSGMDEYERATLEWSFRPAGQ